MRRMFDIVVIADRSTSMEKYMHILNSCIYDIVKTLKDVPGYISDCNLHFSVLQFPVFPEEEAFICKALNIEQDTVLDIPKITARGATNPSPTLFEAVEFVIKRYESWERLRRVHPVIFFLTDGKPDAGADKQGGKVDEREQRQVEEAYEEAANYIRKLQDDEKLQFYAFAMGDADLNMLRKLTNNVFNYTELDMVDAFNAFRDFLLTETRASTSTNRKILEKDRSKDEGGVDGERIKVRRPGYIS